MDFLFDEAVSVEATALLLKRAGGRMNYTVALKILYLADRESLRRWGRPITGARTVNMDHGPVLSEVLNLMKGLQMSPLWEQYIRRDNYFIELVTPPSLGELSAASRALLDELFAQYGGRTFGEMIDYCHTLPEWHDPQGTSEKLDAVEILRAVGKTDEEIASIARDANYYNAARSKFHAS